jgi:microcystin-dependent protein
MPVKHPFTSSKADGADATLVRPSNWNADHAITNTVAPTTSDFGNVAAAGSSTEAALADHRHGREANPLTQTGGDETAATVTTTGVFEYAPLATDYQIRWNGTANATIYGITGQLSNRRIIFRNITTGFSLTLSHEDTTEVTAASRLSLPGNTDFVVGPRQVVELIYQGASARWIVVGNPLVPTGVILPFGGATAPAGWLLCNGTAVSRTTYAPLFAVIGTAYGPGDGSTTFNLPNLCYDGTNGQGYFPLGRRASGTATVLGESGGNIDHTHNAHGTVLGSHTTVGAHTHDNHSAVLTGKVAAALGGSSATVGGANAAGAAHDHGPGTLAGLHNSVGDHSHDAHSGTHSALNPPYLTVMYIIAT